MRISKTDITVVTTSTGPHGQVALKLTLEKVDSNLINPTIARRTNVAFRTRKQARPGLQHSKRQPAVGFERYKENGRGFRHGQ